MDEYTEVRPQKSNRRPMIIGGVAAILLGCCALLFVTAAILVLDPFGLNIVSRLTGRYDAAATVMPADVSFYAGVNLLNLKPEEISRVSRPFFEAVGDPVVTDLDSARGEFAEELEAETGINFETDVLPWIGQHIGFGLTDLTLGSFGDVEEAGWLLAVEARDKDAADQFLIKFRDSVADSSGNSFSEQSYENVTIYVMQSSDPLEQVAFGRSGSLVIMGTGAAAVQEAIDAQKGDSLDERDDYRQLIAQLPRSRALMVYMGGEQIRELVADTTEDDVISLNTEAIPFTNFNSAATAVSIVEAGLQIDMVTLWDREQLSANQQALLDAADQPPQTIQLFPQNTVVYMAGQRLDLFWLAIREATGDVVAFDESMDALGREFGINPNTDLFPLLDGEWAIGVLPSQSGLLSEEMDVKLGFVLVAATSQPAVMGQTLESFRDALEGQRLLVNQEQSDGIIHYHVSLDEDMPPVLNFGIGQGYLFISSGSDTTNEIFANSASLADSERYQMVQAEFEQSMIPALYIDIRSLIGSLREGRTGPDLEGVNDEVRVIEPITAIAVGNAYDNDSRHTRLILFIETE